jgi:hypothetical protein
MSRLTPTVKKILLAARQNINDNGKHWIQRAYAATDKDKRKIFENPFVHGYEKAKFFCAVGGVDKAIWESFGSPNLATFSTSELCKYEEKVKPIRKAVLQRLFEYIPFEDEDREYYDIDFPDEAVIEFNDHSSRKAEEVIALFDAAVRPKR